MFITRKFPWLIAVSCLSPHVSAQVPPQSVNKDDKIATAAAPIPVVKSCPIPQYATIEGANLDVDDNDIVINSTTVNMRQDKFAEFNGNVTLVKSDQRIKAQRLNFDREQSTITAEGDIHFQSDSINVFADRLSASEQAAQTELINSSYQLANNPGHGSAAALKIKLDGTVVLVDSSFTTCYGDTPDWQISASEISISAKDNVGKAYNARLEIFDVPVFYLPYFTFPVTEARKSGFLYPSISSSQNSGLTIETPYYWNIAPNYDATITPRYMSKRGLQLLTEFRYLHEQQSGIIDLEYLHKDDELVNDNDPRYLARFQHTGTFSERFRAHIDYTTISDDNYLVDIGSKHYNANDAYLYQVGELAYFADTWQITAKLQDFDILGASTASYKTLPQLAFSSQTPLGFSNASFDVYSELSNFVGKDADQQDAQRYHVEAGFNLPFNTPAWFLNSELKVLQTYFEQEQSQNNSNLEEHVSRTLPKLRIHGGVNFDRALSHPKLTGYTQTLEPQLQYLYIPERDQTNIGIYDTNILQDNYDGLFRDRRVSGLDRVIQANQVSWGVTSRILDPSNEEVFRFSVGKINYFNNSNERINQQQGLNIDSSALAAETYFRINQQWQVSADIQYNTEEDSTSQSQFSLDYHFNKNDSLQLNHRYNNDVSGVNLEQISLLSQLTLNKDWRFVGRITQDLQDKRSLESYAGFQYESCCWAVRFAYHRHINSNLGLPNNFNDNREQFNSGFVLQFVFKGLTGKQTSLSTEDMLNASIFGYKRPYFLNN